MNEIEKMMQNIVGKVCTHTIIDPAKCNHRRMTRCCGCDWLDYPPFTAEKQFELLKICFDKYGEIGKVRDVDRCILYIPPNTKGDQAFITTDYINFEIWEESIAGLINSLWQDLTEEEKKQIKEILE